MADHTRRVVITGLGVIAPNGIGKTAFWEANLSGRSGIRRITSFDASALPTQIAGDVPDFDPLERGLTLDESRSLDRCTQFAIAAAREALADGGLLDAMSEAQRERMGVYLGTAMSSVDEGQQMWRQVTGWGAHSPRDVHEPLRAEAFLTSHVPSGALAAHFALHGPSEVFSTGCSAGADAIGQAFWVIQNGRVDRMLAGGTDSAINLSGINVFSVMRALSTRNDEPERASRSYDGERDGFVMAEGAGVLLLEERELALARGAYIYAEITTFVSNSNAYHMTALPDDGQPLQHLLRLTMQEARITPRQIGYINSHGSSTVANERAETAAYKAVFGDVAYAIPISATKSMIGHTQGAASAIETIVTALALDQQILPPTINQTTPDPLCDLDYVPNVARPASFDLALTHSSGFGGVNSALVLVRSAYGDMYWAERERATQQHTASPPHTTATPARTVGRRGRRVVVTGLGVVAPNGIGTEAFWRATVKGQSGIQPLQRFSASGLPIGVAGEVGDFVAEHYLDRKLVYRSDRMTHLALVAVDEALRDARLALEGESPQRVGVSLANTFGGVEYVLEQVRVMHERGPRAMSAFSAIAWLQVANVGQVSLRYGLQGYCKTPVNDTIGGLDALGTAYRAIERGAADIMIAGGCEAPMAPYILLLLAQSGHFASGDDVGMYRPFDRRASGLVLAEGAGVCILEDYEHALARGAPLYGEIVGYGQTGDARTLPMPFVDGKHYARAIDYALQESGVHPRDVGYFGLDGRAMPDADLAETDALQRVFGADLEGLPVSVPRTSLGHSYAAAGAIDTITALLALRDGVIPPTINVKQPDPRYSLRLVRDEPLSFDAPAVLLGGRSLCGANSALALKRIEDSI